MMAQLEAPPQPQAEARPDPAPAVVQNIADPSIEHAHFGDVPLRLEAVLGRLTMNMRAVASLEEGSVLTLAHSAGDNVELCVSGVKLASGEIVVIEDSLGVRITDLLAGD